MAEKTTWSAGTRWWICTRVWRGRQWGCGGMGVWGRARVAIAPPGCRNLYDGMVPLWENKHTKNRKDV